MVAEISEVLRFLLGISCKMNPDLTYLTYSSKSLMISMEWTIPFVVALPKEPRQIQSTRQVCHLSRAILPMTHSSLANAHFSIDVCGECKKSHTQTSNTMGSKAKSRCHLGMLKLNKSRHSNLNVIKLENYGPTDCVLAWATLGSPTPKMAKSSTVTSHWHWHFCTNLCQWEQSLWSYHIPI